MSRSNPRILIVQEYIPHYRVPFFNLLRSELSLTGVECDVIYGAAAGRKLARLGDRGLPWAHRIRSYRLGRRATSPTYQCAWIRSQTYDLVVVEQANRLILNYLLLICSRLGGPHVGFWGHGYDHQKMASGFRSRVKCAVCRLPQFWFAYTHQIAAYLVESGCKSDSIQAVQNSTDTRTLRLDLQFISHKTVQSKFRALYLGGLYFPKRLHFLMDAADLIHDLDPRFTLQVCGDGEMADEVREWAHHRAWVLLAGSVTGEEKAAALTEACVILNPGMVGLVAVDSLVAGRPIVTIERQSHSPEFKYLEDRRNCFILAENTSVNEYADFVLDVLQQESYKEVSKVAVEDSFGFSVENMVQNFVEGIHRAIAAKWSR